MLQGSAKDVHRVQAAKENGSGRAAKTRVRVDNFPVGSLLLNSLMTGVITAARGNKELQHKLFQVRWVPVCSKHCMRRALPPPASTPLLPGFWLAVCCPQDTAPTPTQRPVGPAASRTPARRRTSTPR